MNHRGGGGKSWSSWRIRKSKLVGEVGQGWDSLICLFLQEFNVSKGSVWPISKIWRTRIFQTCVERLSSLPYTRRLSQTTDWLKPWQICFWIFCATSPPVFIGNVGGVLFASFNPSVWREPAVVSKLLLFIAAKWEKYLRRRRFLLLKAPLGCWLRLLEDGSFCGEKKWKTDPNRCGGNMGNGEQQQQQQRKIIQGINEISALNWSHFYLWLTACRWWVFFWPSCIIGH